MRKRLFLLCALLAVAAVKTLPGQGDEKLSANDKDFIEYAGEFNLEVTHLGILAQSRSSDRTIKSFGAVVEKEHTGALRKLTAIASKTGGIAPNHLDRVHKDSVDHVKHADGSSFDQQFLKAIVNQHEAALVSYKREADQGFNPDLQAYAKTALPDLEEHLKKAKELSSGLK